MWLVVVRPGGLVVFWADLFCMLVGWWVRDDIELCLCEGVGTWFRRFWSTTHCFLTQPWLLSCRKIPKNMQRRMERIIFYYHSYCYA